MKTIQIRQYTPPQMSVYDNNDNFVGFINHFKEFQWLLEDIRNNSLDDYYIVYGTNTIKINKYGFVGADNIMFIQSLYDIYQY